MSAPSPIARFFFGRIFPIPFILAGAAVMAFGIRDFSRAKSSPDWPTAPGVVVESRVESHSGSKGGTTYHARIRYEYTVNGAVHSGDKVAFGDYGSSDSDHAQQIVNRHPVGEKVGVRHAPDDIEVAVLEPGLKGQAWVMPLGGLVFFCAGLTMAVFLPRALRKQAEANNHPSIGGTITPPPSETHPKVSVTKSFDGTVFETRGNKLIGIIMIVIAVAQSVIVTAVFSKQGGLAFPIPIFLAADAVILAIGAAIFFSGYTVEISPGKVTLTFGVAGKGYRKEIARTSPMSVTLENRGASKNGRPADAIVVRNATGEEFHFGPFLDDSRKQFLAGHLARQLAPKSSARANPFE